MAQGQKIRIRALRPLTQLPVTIRPCQDNTGRLYTGQGKTGHYETLTPDEKNRMSYVVDAFTALSISHDTVFDLDDPIDKANWEWAQKHPYIAPNRKAAESSRDARFYVFDEDKDAVDTVKAEKASVIARYKVLNECSHAELQDAAMALGHPAPQVMKTETLQKWFLVLIDDAHAGKANAERVLKAISKENKVETNATILFKELERAHIIMKHRGGIYKFGGENGVFVGRNQEDVVKYMMDENNKENVAAMTDALQSHKAGIAV